MSRAVKPATPCMQSEFFSPQPGTWNAWTSPQVLKVVWELQDLEDRHRHSPAAVVPYRQSYWMIDSTQNIDKTALATTA